MTPRRGPDLFLGIILIGANLRAPITVLGPVLPDIQRELGLGGLGAGALNALPLLTFALLSLVAPGVGQRHGLERILGYTIGAILVGTIVRSMPWPGAIWIGTVALSAGIAFGNVLLPGLVKRDFPHRAAGLIGYYAAAMAGLAGLSAGLAVPIARLPGLDWRWSLGAWALPSAVALFIWLPQLRAAQHRGVPETGRAPERTSPWRHAIGWQVSLFFSCHSLVFYSIVDWFPSYAAASGISIGEAGYYMLAYQIVAIATNLGSAPLIRKLSDQRALGFLCGVLLLIGTFGLLRWPALSLLWLISAGLGAGIAMVTSLSLFALRVRDHHQAASLSGMAQFVGYMGAAAGPFLMGLLHDFADGWNWPLSVLVGSSALVVCFGTLAGRKRFIE